MEQEIPQEKIQEQKKKSSQKKDEFKKRSNELHKQLKLQYLQILEALKISENQKEESVRYEEELSRKNFLFASIQNFSEICSDMQGLNNEIKEYAILNDNSDQNNLGNKKMTKEKLAKKLDRMDMVEKDFRENYQILQQQQMKSK